MKKENTKNTIVVIEELIDKSNIVEFISLIGLKV